MRAFITSVVALASLIAAGTAYADRANTISIVGSSTVYPFASAVAESFGEASGFNTPIIESTGSGGGMKLFCAGTGLNTPDVTNASRQMKSSEADTCAANGVDFVEFMVGYDGIVMANGLAGVDFDVTVEQIALAVAAQVPDANGNLVENTAETWSDVDAALPNTPIYVLGPPTSSGTRDAFEELVIHKTYKAMGFDKATYKSIEIREDGAYIESGENDSLIIDQLANDVNAVGIFGFSFLQNNQDRVKGAVINSFEPTFENIASGDYPVSRSLFFYVKTNHIGVVEGIAEYAEEFVFQAAPEGTLTSDGLIPGGDAEQDAMYEALDQL
jgi:phosphate transport system substrate-binding protein